MQPGAEPDTEFEVVASPRQQKIFKSLSPVRYNSVGDQSGEGIPKPIPNLEVKLSSDLPCTSTAGKGKALLTIHNNPGDHWLFFNASRKIAISRGEYIVKQIFIIVQGRNHALVV